MTRYPLALPLEKVPANVGGYESRDLARGLSLWYVPALVTPPLTSILRPSLRSGAGWQGRRPRPYGPLRAAFGSGSLHLASKGPRRTLRIGASHTPTLVARRPKCPSPRGASGPYPIPAGRRRR